MPRRPRVAPAGHVYHVLNRSAGRTTLFRTAKDFSAFQQLIAEAQQRHPLRILAYCLMPNHWHFVAWPSSEGQLTAFFRWLTHTHVMRWRVAHRTVGYGPLYQGRFKSFIIQKDQHLLTACRYVERNARSAGLVRSAANWRWGSLWVRQHGDEAQRAVLSDWPVPLPRNWPAHVDQPLTQAELQRLALSERRNRPFGDDAWTARTADRLGLTHTIRPEGRPPKQERSPAAGEN
jgi:putative transposase